MNLEAVIFDMDGLLIDSEPLWQEAGGEVMAGFGVQLTDEQYHSSTGLRTPEWVAYWFARMGIDAAAAPEAIQRIEAGAIEKIKARGTAMPGVKEVFEFFRQRKYKIGLASSSPLRLIEVVVDKLAIHNYLDAVASAEGLPFGKPHPQVFMNCAASLEVGTRQCLCFEDSFNGLIAAKAAGMKCIVVPAAPFLDQRKWEAADAKLSSLSQMNDQVLGQIIIH